MQIKHLSDFPDDFVLLHLEDMDSYLQQMTHSLQQLNYHGHILRAKTVKDALTLCNKNKIDLIIADWNLPDSTGLEFLKAIRKSKKFATTPFIMCTTMNEVGDMINAVKEGANDYIVKPWKVADLENKIVIIWNLLNK